MPTSPIQQSKHLINIATLYAGYGEVIIATHYLTRAECMYPVSSDQLVRVQHALDMYNEDVANSKLT